MNSLGIDAADDLVVEDELALGGRPHVDLGVAVLAAAAGLADVAPLAVGLLRDRLPVGDLRLADVGADVELAHQAVDDDLEVQLAHAGDDRLAGVLVGVDAEGRILLHQLAERHAELLLVGLGLRLDRHRDDRLGEVHRLEHDRVLGIADRVAGGDVLQADRGGDVAGPDLVDLLALVGVHLEQAADALVAVALRVRAPWSPTRRGPSRRGRRRAGRRTGRS